MAGTAAAATAAVRLPSISQQKSFIVENAGILNGETKIAIYSIVMMEIGQSVVMETGGAKEVDIDLDAVAAANEEVLRHIYNIVLTRREALSQPAGAQPARPEPTKARGPTGHAGGHAGGDAG